MIPARNEKNAAAFAVHRAPLQGEVVAEWVEFGHHFQIEKLLEPLRRGASDRYYRLWDNGHPHSGGQWHYDIAGAKSRARYALICDYAGRIAFLELEVNSLRRQLHEATRPDILS